MMVWMPSTPNPSSCCLRNQKTQKGKKIRKNKIKIKIKRRLKTLMGN